MLGLCGAGMTKNAMLKIEFLAGTDIFDAAEEAVTLSEKLNIGVTFNFNGVDCTMWPGDSPKILKEQYLTAGNLTKDKTKMAFGH
jgi:hypothetical protein